MDSQVPDLQNIHAATILVENINPLVSGDHLGPGCEEDVVTSAFGDFFPEQTVVRLVSDHTSEKSRLS